MAKRQIIEIDNNKCNGCGNCVPNCYEGALQIIDGKARLVSDLFCDGLGNCVGHCPQNAMKVIEREARPYDERKVMEKIIPQGMNTVKAHLEHLRDHNADEYLQEAQDYLQERGIDSPLETLKQEHYHACPGSREIDFDKEAVDINVEVPSQLRQWPIQLHLINPNAPYFQNANILLAADCTAYAFGNFHSEFLKGKKLVIACPKLDSNQEIYVDKIKSMIDDANIKELTVLIMEVPCCRGLAMIAEEAVDKANNEVSVTTVVVGIDGRIVTNK